MDFIRSKVRAKQIPCPHADCKPTSEDANYLFFEKLEPHYRQIHKDIKYSKGIYDHSQILRKKLLFDEMKTAFISLNSQDKNKVGNAFKLCYNAIELEVYAATPKMAVKMFGVLLHSGGYIQKFGNGLGTEVKLISETHCITYRVWYETMEYDIYTNNETIIRNGVKIVAHATNVKLLSTIKTTAHIPTEPVAMTDYVQLADNNGSSIDRVLQTQFGLDSFRPGQKEVISSALSGKNILYIAPTGSGKTITFFLPALLIIGLTIVILPLISLMTDMSARANYYKIPCEMISQNTTDTKMSTLLYDLKQDTPKTKLLFVTPESFVLNKELNKAILDLNHRKKIDRIVIDECHCVIAWGHSFRPSYLDACERVIGLGVPVMLTTATATTKIQNKIIECFRLNNCQIFKSSVNRLNISYNVKHVKKKDTILEEIIRLLQRPENENKCGIIYCPTPSECRDIGFGLQLHNISYTLYYADELDTNTRKNNLAAWLDGKKKIMVATKAAGTGLDKKDVRFVVHTQMPDSIEEYHQQSGRCGRDGLLSQALLFYRDTDVNLHLKHISEVSNCEYQAESISRLIQMLLYCSTLYCRKKYILQYFDEQSGDCSNMCDNCTANVLSETILKTIDACNLTKCVQAVLTIVQKPSIDMCIKTFVKSNSKIITDNKLDKLPEYGNGKHMNIKESRHLVYNLILNDVFSLKVDKKQTGHNYKSYLLLSSKSAQMLRQEIAIHIQKHC